MNLETELDLEGYRLSGEVERLEAGEQQSKVSADLSDFRQHVKNLQDHYDTLRAALEQITQQTAQDSFGIAREALAVKRSPYPYKKPSGSASG